jgi:hypothetical protein
VLGEGGSTCASYYCWDITSTDIGRSFKALDGRVRDTATAVSEIPFDSFIIKGRQKGTQVHANSMSRIRERTTRGK